MVAEAEQEPVQTIQLIIYRSEVREVEVLVDKATPSVGITQPPLPEQLIQVGAVGAVERKGLRQVGSMALPVAPASSLSDTSTPN
ncbi:hypothetical protein A3B57_02615 [Microgenomates group bacterium RIFCSPLOWO2_01_FULL_47_10]|nr:MAG: hypothetical protein A3B57_02615 [Microgenomates group bacterium RIFCSPLOWO2_01_FULL_47_10]